MKRATVLLLALSLVAVPTFAADKAVHKVASARCVSLEHISGAWRMEIECDQTKGAILLIDTGRDVEYAGQGIFKGWSQGELSSMYRSLIPKVESDLVMMQLG
jgi:hypothetical protein